MSLALYRKYRPGTFAELVGQEHVTGPLSAALTSGRTHHAYLLSGPRGCGKTSSARILARSLNCVDGPTPTPCGVCDSCVGLAPNGPGTLDVIEIDAASHGLIDDARDLRDRAFYAPVSSRYKVYIIDEAHMISTGAFNALLKVVEEPPPHVTFIFATTEPDKVLPTIRSRTFHYRFRLVAPSQLRDLLADVCAREGITVDPLALPLIVRAGAGSVRDALSVLDQLAAGSGPEGITYDGAIALLGFTDATLLDEVVDAFAAGDGASVFASVERVIEAGLDPRRFAQDLLERVRDLLVVDAVPDAGDSGLLDRPADELSRMTGQAARWGRAPMTHAGQVLATALVDMRGTTSPRLVLELACARILLPGAGDDPLAMLSRLDRIERRLAVGGADLGTTAPPAVAAPAPAPAAPAAPNNPSPAAPAAPTAPAASAPAATPTPAATTATAVAAPPAAAAPSDAPGGPDLVALRRMWESILDAVKGRSRSVHAMLLQYASIHAVDARSITLAFSHAEIARQVEDRSEFFTDALAEVTGLRLEMKTVVAGSAAAATTAPAGAPSTEPAETTARAVPAVPAPEPVAPAEPYAEPDSEEIEQAIAADPDTVRREASDDAVDLVKAGLGAEIIAEIDPAG